MKIVAGHLALKENFYHRPKVIREIYRKLPNTLFLAAPRRMGKSSILHFLEDKPKENHCFVYVNVESVSNMELFFEYLAKALLESKQIGKWSKMKTKTWQSFLDALDKINTITVLDNRLEVSVSANRYYQAFADLLSQVQNSNVKTVLMIDELPQAIAHIHKHQGKKQANVFLHLLRKIRLDSPQNIGFIYTGSIGLKGVVKKVTTDPVLNDIKSVTIPPFKYKEAIELCEQLLNHYEISFEEGSVEYLLSKMGSYIPYHLQLLVSNLIDLSDDLEIPIDKELVDKAFLQMLLPEHDKVFRHYHSRLKTLFSSKERKFVLCLLELIAENKEVTKTTAKGLAAKFKCQKNVNLLLETLNYDGYIYADEEGNFRFISLLLLEWWRKYVLNW